MGKEKMDVDLLNQRSSKWKDIETMAERDPLYPKVQPYLGAAASVLFAMRAQQTKDGAMQEPHNIDTSHASEEFQGTQMSGADQLRRKSVLPTAPRPQQDQAG